MSAMPRVLVLALGACALACSSTEPPAQGESTGAASSETSTGGATSSTTGDTTTGVDTTGDGTTGAPIWSGSLVVMTFNVLCSFCDDTFDPWDDRVPWMGDTIARHQPDLVGLQELTFPEEVDELLAVAPEYAAIWYGVDGRSPYPDATIFYRTAVFEPVEHGSYWLSPTPDSPMSTGFADHFQLPRLVVWTILRRTDDGAELFFATTHFDNNSPSQELSAPLVLERTPAAAAQRPVIVVGDFNSRPDSTAYGILTTATDFHFDDAFDLAPQWSMETNQRPMPEYDTTQRIDHVFVAGAPWQVARWVVDTWHYGPNDLSVSDHFAIVAELAL